MTTYAHTYPQTMTTDTSGVMYRLSTWTTRHLQEQRLKRTISNERRQLATLSAEMLKDIGVDRARAITEAKRDNIPSGRM